MKLTACSIVKNEERNIARSIKSYREVVDEIIIVDTGSTDKTVEICKELGAQVIHYEWKGDFAAAKNFALDHARGEWVIFLDADEWFVPKLGDEKIFDVLRYAESKKDVEILRTTLCNIEEETGEINSKTSVARIFKNSPEVRYVGKIHEDLRKNSIPMKSAFLEALEVYHGGYSQDRVQDKSKRNLKMLYDMYKKGKAEHGTYFYLCRENFILQNMDESLKFYDFFFEQENIDQFIQSANIFVSIYEFGIKLKLFKSEKFTRQDVKATIDLAIQKYPQLPIHYYLEGCYYSSYDYNLALKSFEKAIEVHKAYNQDYINTFEGSVYDTYFRIARIHKIHQNQEKVFDYLVLALQNQPLQKDAFREILPLIRSEAAADIILFLNTIYSMSEKEHVAFLAKQFMTSKCQQVFLYYSTKYNKEFGGQDETTYTAMMLTGQAEYAVRTAMTAYFNAGKEEDRYFAALAILYSERKDLFEEYRIHLNSAYSQIINRHLSRERLKNPSEEEVSAWVHLYNHMYYLVESEVIKMFEDLFEETPQSVVTATIQQALGYQDYTELVLKGEKLRKNQKQDYFDVQLNKIIAFGYYYTKSYGTCLEYFKEILGNNNTDMDITILIYLRALCEKKDNELVNLKALKLYEKYEPIFMQYIQVIDMLKTGQLNKFLTEHDQLNIKELSKGKLIQEIEEECVKLPQTVLDNLFLLIEKYLDQEMDEAAYDSILVLLKNNYKKDIMYYRLGEIFTRLGNPELSLYCHKQVFIENAAFAATLIQDSNQEKHWYIYKEGPLQEIENCPLCGQYKNIHSVFNTIPSLDFKQGDVPIKVWKYCEGCRHKFATQILEDTSFNLTKKESKELIQQISKNIVDKAMQYNETLNLLTQYVKGYKLLDVGSGEGAFLAAAMEYGFQVKGIEPIAALAEESHKLLQIVVENCTFEEYKDNQRYDVISIISALERLKDIKQVLKKSYMLLNEEGILYIETPNLESSIAKIFKDKNSILHSPKVNQYFSRASLEKILEGCRFEIINYRMSKINKGYMEVIARRK